MTFQDLEFLVAKVDFGFQKFPTFVDVGYEIDIYFVELE